MENVVRVYDKRFIFEQSRTQYAVGGLTSVIRSTNVAPSISNSGVTINVTPPASVAIDSVMRARIQGVVNISGTNTSPSLGLLQPDTFAGSFLSMFQVLGNQTLQLNDSTVTLTQCNHWLPHILASYEDAQTLMTESSGMPSMRDYSNQFLQLPAAGTSSISPLANTIDQTMAGGQVPRGAFPGVTVTSNAAGATSATLSYDLIFQVVVPPLQFGKGSFDAPCFGNINSMLYQVTFDNFQKLISLASLAYTDATGTATVTNVVPSISFFELSFDQYVLSPEIVIPTIQYHALPYIQYLPSNIPVTIAAGASYNIVGNTQIPASVPVEVYTWVSAYEDSYAFSGTALSCTVPIAYLPWGTGVGQPLGQSAGIFQILSDSLPYGNSFDIYEWYRLSAKNGNRLSLAEFVGIPVSDPTQFSTGIGPCVRLKFGHDIPLNAGVTVGMLRQFPFQVQQLSVNNNTGRDIINPTLSNLFVFDGIQKQEGYSIVNKNSSFSPEQVARLPLSQNASAPSNDRVFGGSFWDTIKSIAGPILDVVKSTGIVGNLASQIPGVGQFAGPVAKSLGFGYPQIMPQRRPRMVGGRLHY